MRNLKRDLQGVPHKCSYQDRQVPSFQKTVSCPSHSVLGNTPSLRQPLSSILLQSPSLACPRSSYKWNHTRGLCGKESRPFLHNTVFLLHVLTTHSTSVLSGVLLHGYTAILLVDPQAVSPPVAVMIQLL